MDHAKKLVELMGAASIDYREPRTFEEIAQATRCYHDLSLKLEAEGKDKVERISEEYTRLLAQAVQGEARERYGLADAAAIRKVLTEGWEAYSKEVWDRQMNLIKAEAIKAGVDGDDQAALMEMLEGFPDMMLDVLSAEAARLKLVPLENMSEISLTLAEMIKEESHADEGTDNGEVQEAEPEN